MAGPNNNRRGPPPMSPARGNNRQGPPPMSPAQGSNRQGPPPMSPAQGNNRTAPGINIDGASDTPSRGGSQRGGSASGAPSGAPPAHPGYPAPMGFDPARDPNPKGPGGRSLAPLTPTERVNKRCELPAEAYQVSEDVFHIITQR